MARLCLFAAALVMGMGEEARGSPSPLLSLFTATETTFLEAMLSSGISAAKGRSRRAEVCSNGCVEDNNDCCGRNAACDCGGACSCGGCCHRAGCGAGFHTPTTSSGCTKCGPKTYQSVSGFKGTACEPQPVCNHGEKFVGNPDSTTVGGKCIPCERSSFQSKENHYDTECTACTCDCCGCDGAPCGACIGGHCGCVPGYHTPVSTGCSGVCPAGTYQDVNQFKGGIVDSG